MISRTIYYTVYMYELDVLSTYTFRRKTRSHVRNLANFSKHHTPFTNLLRRHRDTGRGQSPLYHTPLISTLRRGVGGCIFARHTTYSSITAVSRCVAVLRASSSYNPRF